jgi:uncharacterized protein
MTDEQLRDIYKKYHVIATVGLSSKADRPSLGVATFLKSKGFRIIPVNPNENEVLGEKSYPDLGAVPDKFDIVQIFRRPEHVPAIVETAIKKGAKVVWMQDGAGNPEAAKRAEEAGLVAVVDDCMYREYLRLFGL